MSTINGRQRTAGFQRSTPICGNCVHEQRERNEKTQRIERSCALLGCFVLLSSTCESHEYRQKGGRHAAANR